MTVVDDPAELESRPRAVAVGTFDGVHLGHRRVLEALVAATGTPTVVTFDPHPRGARLLASIERRLELLADAGVADVVVLGARPAAAELARDVLRPLGARVVVGGATADLDALERHGLEVLRVPVFELAATQTIRELLEAGTVEEAARLLGRPPEVDGRVVAGHARGKALGFPTANLQTPPGLLVPRRGIYAGAARGHRAAISVGVNPHYGDGELSVEAFLLDFDGDLYGERLVVELWRFLREEQAFASEQELIDAIARDVAETRSAVRPG